jgi:hypothetical protein
VTDTETLMSSPTLGFGIETLSPLQRAKSRIIDGRPLGDLAARDDVRRMLGCDPELLAGIGQPSEVIDISGIRTGKTIGCAAVCYRMSQTVDVSPVLTGEAPPRIFWVSTTTEQARPGFDVFVGTIMSRAALRAAVVGEPTSDSVKLRHPSGIVIEVKIAPAAKAGSTLVGRWCAGAVFDEAPRWQTVDEGYRVSLEDCRTAIRGRLLKGAQLFYPGSPWAPEGWPYRMFEERFGKPGADLVVLRASAPDLNPVWWTPTRVAEVRAAEPRTAKMDIDAEFGSTASTAYGLDDVDAAGKERPAQYRYGPATISIDPSKLMGRDQFGVAVLRWAFPTSKRVEVLMPPPPGSGILPTSMPPVLERGRPKTIPVDPNPVLVVEYAEAWGDLDLDEVKQRLSQLVRLHRPTLATMDLGGDTATLAGHFTRCGVSRVEIFSWSQAQRRSGFEWVGRMLHDRRIYIPQEPARRDLLKIQVELQPKGEVRYFARRTATGHADIASALVSYAIAECEGMIVGSPYRRFLGGRSETSGR